ncbi:MAG: EAL domain-containing protein, partial [Granulosicoccaceae bacterium]
LDFEQSGWDAGAIDKVPAAISINAADGELIRMNDRYLAMFGEGDLEGDDTHALDSTLTDLERPDAIENLFKAESELHRRKACVVRELVLNGEEQPRSLCYVGVPLVENNRLQGYFNMVLDPTETSGALALPRSLEQRAMATVQCLEDALISVDNRGLVRYLNPAAQSLLNADLSQVAGLSLGDICHLQQAEGREEIDLNNLLNEDFSLGSIDLDNILLIAHDSREIALHIRCSPVRNADGIRQGSTFLFQDITQQRRMAETLLRQANIDQLTGLENRQRFTQHLEKSLREVRRSSVEQVLLYIDLDKFKLVNDSAGHIAGDALLQQLATLISTRLRDGDRLGRLGGDEFGILVTKNATKRAPLLAKQLVDDLSEFRFNWQGRSFDVKASIGIATVSSEVNTALELLQRAVVACQTAKDSGHWNFLVYGSGNSMPAQRRQEMRAVSLVRDALDNNRFRLFAQPIVAISERAKAHGIQRYELLLRMLGDNDEVLSPGAFMPAAERYGMMPMLDRWVILYALEACAELHHNNSTCYELGINLSGASLSDPELLGFVQNEFARHGLQGNRVCFEITETEEITEIAVAQNFISEMRNEGCTFALDDFGSGLSSFTYLKELSVDYLKIDGSFVKDINRNSIDRSIVEGVVTVGNKVGLPTIAEFVETEETLQLLKRLGVDYAQGWHLGRARPLTELMGAVQQD